MKADFESIKRQTDIVRVVESYGVVLKKSGKDHVGLCPFHEDHTPSLRVTAAKGLFRCPACGAAGNVIQFVARKEGLTDREAALKLLSLVPGVTSASQLPTPANTSEQPAAAVVPAPANAAALLQRVAGFYARAFYKDRAGLEYLKIRQLTDPSMLAGFQVGYCDGTLRSALPDSGDLVSGLTALGVLNARGYEHFRGCVTVPITDEQGEVCGIYGRRVEFAAAPPSDLPRHLYLPGPHRGVFNHGAAKGNRTLLIAESILDAMSLWQAGYQNVIAIYGTGGWTADHERLLRQSGTREALLCLDNDKAGREGTERLREQLSALNIESRAVPWPEGVKDANEFFASRGPEEFEQLLASVKPQRAEPVQGGRLQPEPQVTATATGFNVQCGKRLYELRGIDRPSPAKLRATIKAVSAATGRFHVDTVDFYLSRSRRPFILESARLFAEMAEVVEGDFNRLTELMEQRTESAVVAEGAAASGPVLSEADKAEAIRLGRNPDLVGEILRDLEKLGLVGERSNAMIGYLAMTSRKMDDPMALLILSCSGAGKSHLQDTVLSLCPEEDLVKLTSLSDRALFYKGEDSLKQKVLALEEEAGAAGAAYPIRNLISARKLVIETTVKNPLTGQLTTQLNTVNGPTAVFLTTTNPESDAETRSRFMIISVDESAGQTRAIVEAQRQSHTLEGLLRKSRQTAIQARHHAFQRQLKPLHVVNPYEPLLSYGDGRLLVRRDNPKYLRLILTVAFLNQMQRPIRRHAELGEYVEVTLDDIAVANDLAVELFGHSVDELSAPSRELLRLIGELVRRESSRPGVAARPVRFSRRQMRELFKWSDARLRLHLAELVRMEYVLPVGGGLGKAFEYELACEADRLEPGRFFLSGLKTVEQLRQEANLAGLGGGVAGKTGGVATTSQVKTCGVGDPVERLFTESKRNGTSNLATVSGGI